MREFIAAFGIILFLFLFVYYLIPVSITYYVMFIRNRSKWAKKRIRFEFPSPKSIRHEIKWSLVTVLIFSALTMLVYHFAKLGYTALYYEIRGYGWIYFVGSPLVAALLHDTYYYWVHRFMHHKRIFKYVHRIHHRSLNPTPWAIYSFHPTEAILTYLIFPLLIFFLPLHPIALGALLLHNLVVNIGGHTGFELASKFYAKHWLLKYNNVVTFHDMHHTNTRCNYGLYFNIWDRIMNTVHPDFETEFSEVKRRANDRR
jgi:Delta7-sterol 5-desaturase